MLYHRKGKWRRQVELFYNGDRSSSSLGRGRGDQGREEAELGDMGADTRALLRSSTEMLPESGHNEHTSQTRRSGWYHGTEDLREEECQKS